MPTARRRPDKDGAHRGQFEINRKKIFATQTICGICGQPVDFDLKYPNPLAATVDHIVPIAKGGHPSAIENLQLAHWICNRRKSDKLTAAPTAQGEKVEGPRVLPQSMDWTTYTG